MPTAVTRHWRLQGMPRHQENLVKSNSPSANNQIIHTRPSVLEECNSTLAARQALAWPRLAAQLWVPAGTCSLASTPGQAPLLVAQPDHDGNQDGTWLPMKPSGCVCHL